MSLLRFFPYVADLEARVRFLESQNTGLMKVIEQLTAVRPSKTAQDIVESRKRHEITTTSTGARCACGQIFTGGDPARLQEAITGHVTSQLNKVLHGGRKSWPEIRQKAEQSALQEDPA
jgi:hypothetical protein